MNLGQLEKRIRSLVDDPDATFTTEAYLVPLIGQVHDQSFLKVRSTDNPFDERLVEVPGINAGRGDLIDEQRNENKPLFGLIQPTKIEYKVAGASPLTYQPIGDLRGGASNALPDTIPAQAIFAWEFRAGYIYFTPAATAMDIRIRGEFLPSVWKSEQDLIDVGLAWSAAMATGTAKLIGISRGNPGWIKEYGEAYMDSLDDVMAALAKADQQKIHRFARQTGRRTSGRRGGGATHY